MVIVLLGYESAAATPETDAASTSPLKILAKARIPVPPFDFNLFATPRFDARYPAHYRRRPYDVKYANLIGA